MCKFFFTSIDIFLLVPFWYHRRICVLIKFHIISVVYARVFFQLYRLFSISFTNPLPLVFNFNYIRSRCRCHTHTHANIVAMDGHERAVRQTNKQIIKQNTLSHTHQTSINDDNRDCNCYYCYYKYFSAISTSHLSTTKSSIKFVFPHVQ